MAYKIKKNRKGHYSMIKSDSPPAAAQEMERLMKINEDIIRVMTIKVAKHQEGPSTMVKAKNKSDDISNEISEDRVG